MNVKEACVKICEKYNVEHPGVVGDIQNKLSFDDYVKVIDFMHWAYVFSNVEMTRKYGEVWGGHPDLPPNIDEATTLTVEQEQEFYCRLDKLPNCG